MKSRLDSNSNASSSAYGQDIVKFKLVSCLLTAEELDQKCDELLSVIWNGANTLPPTP